MEYLDSRIASANQAELVAIMYEGLIKKLKDSIENIQNNDSEKLTENITKTRNIIAELIATLKGDSEVAMNYKSLYMYMNKLITSANVSKDIEKLQEVIDIATPIYEGWTELGEKMFKEDIEKGRDTKVVSGMTYGKGHLNDDILEKGTTFEA